MALSGMDIQVYDISNPYALLKVGSVKNTGSLAVATVDENILYAFDSYALEVIDITYPQAPVKLGSVDFIDEAASLVVAGNFAYVAEDYPGFIEVIDIGNPMTPKAIGITQISGWARDIFVKDSFAFVADAVNGLKVIDISQSYSPKSYAKISSIGWRELGSADDVAVAGNYAYVLDFNKMQVIDISLQEAPELVMSLDIPAFASLLSLNGHFVYVVSSGTVSVIDISMPESPVIIASIDLPVDEILFIKIDDKHATFYTRTFVSPQSDDLREKFAYDISNPLSPVLIDR